MTHSDDGARPSDARDELSRIMGIADEPWKVPNEFVADSVVLIPVEDKGQVCGNAVVARCYEKTGDEVTVWCRSPIRSRYVLLEPVSEELNLMAAHIEVIRQVAVGSLYELRGQFIVLPVSEISSREG